MTRATPVRSVGGKSDNGTMAWRDSKVLRDWDRPVLATPKRRPRYWFLAFWFLYFAAAITTGAWLLGWL